MRDFHGGAVVEERRREPRYRIDAEMSVNEARGRTINLSANSVYFESTQPFALGEEVALVFPFEHVVRGTSVRCTARVVRVDPRGSAYGIAATYQPVAFSLPADSRETTGS